MKCTAAEETNRKQERKKYGKMITKLEAALKKANSLEGKDVAKQMKTFRDMTGQLQEWLADHDDNAEASKKISSFTMTR